MLYIALINQSSMDYPFWPASVYCMPRIQLVFTITSCFFHIDYPRSYGNYWFHLNLQFLKALDLMVNISHVFSFKLIRWASSSEPLTPIDFFSGHPTTSSQNHNAIMLVLFNIQIDGMTCGSCVQLIQSVVSQLDGVQAVEVSHTCFVTLSHLYSMLVDFIHVDVALKQPSLMRRSFGRWLYFVTVFHAAASTGFPCMTSWWLCASCCFTYTSNHGLSNSLSSCTNGWMTHARGDGYGWLISKHKYLARRDHV